MDIFHNDPRRWPPLLEREREALFIWELTERLNYIQTHRHTHPWCVLLLASFRLVDSEVTWLCVVNKNKWSCIQICVSYAIHTLLVVITPLNNHHCWWYIYIYIHIYSSSYLSTIHDKGEAIKLTFYCEKLHIISYLISRERSLFFGWKRFLDKTPVYLPGLWIQRRMSATGAEDRFWFFCELAGKQATLPNAPKA